MPELSHDRPEPDPRSGDVPRDLDEALREDPAEGQADDRRPPEPDEPQPEPGTPAVPSAHDDLVTDEGVNAGASEMVEESPEADA